jgi:uncharacterized coiled-coil DUF342 family protein
VMWPSQFEEKLEQLDNSYRHRIHKLEEGMLKMSRVIDTLVADIQMLKAVVTSAVTEIHSLSDQLAAATKQVNDLNAEITALNGPAVAAADVDINAMAQSLTQAINPPSANIPLHKA